MYLLRVCITLIFVCFFVVQTAFAAQTLTPPAINVLTYNIRYLNSNDGQDIWRNRRDAVCEVIKQADLIGLQEVLPPQLDDIRQATPDFEWYGVGRDDGNSKGEMTAIGFRKSMFKVQQRGTFWLSPTPEEVGSQGWDAALPRIASWLKLSLQEASPQILFVNTHFDHRGSTARRESALLLRTWIAANRDDDLPVILTGDLNAQVSDAPLQALLARSSSDAPELLDAKSAPGIADQGPDSTWNGFREIALGRRLDHILYRGQLQVLDYQTLDPRTKEGRFASDHMPVKATLRFSAP